MTEIIKITRAGNAIGLSAPDGSALSEARVAEIRSLLQYTRVDYEPRERRYLSTSQYMVDVGANGWLLTTIGLQPKIQQYFKEQGVSFTFEDRTPKEKDPLRHLPMWQNLDGIQFRERQEECLHKLCSVYCGIIDATMGFGKTFLICQLIKVFPEAIFHITTRSSKILNDIYDEIVQITPNVGRVGDGYCDTSKRITVVNADSLHKVDGSKVDFLIFDECHRAAANTYLEDVMRIYPYSRNFGFSGTVDGRSDKASPVLEMVFGPKLFSLDYMEAENLDLVVPLDVYWLMCDKASADPYDFKLQTARYRNCIWRNEYRHELLADYLETNHKDSKVLILVDSLEHGLYLRKCMPEFEICYGTMSKKQLDKFRRLRLLPADYKPLNARAKAQLANDFKNNNIRKVIATSVWVEGVSFDDLEVVVIASGSSAVIPVIQGSGRVSRKHEDKFKGKVIDFRDVFSPYFLRKSEERQRQYKKRGWKQFVIED